MDEVNKAVAAGVSFAGAVKDKLGVSTEEFTVKHGLNRTQFSLMINGRLVPDEKQLTALIAQLGGTSQGWLDLWFKVAARKVATRA